MEMGRETLLHTRCMAHGAIMLRGIHRTHFEDAEPGPLASALIVCLQQEQVTDSRQQMFSSKFGRAKAAL